MMATAHRSNSKDKPITLAAEVRHVAGPIDDGTVAALLRVGASRQELEMAARYARGEGDLVDCAGNPLSGRVAQVYEILSADEADEDESIAPR